MAARTRKGTATSGWPVEVRQRIQTSMLINRLTDHALGKIKMEPTQVRAIEILLRKTMPDLSQIDGTMKVTRDVAEMDDAELAAIAAGRGARTVATASGPEEPDQLH